MAGAVNTHRSTLQQRIAVVCAHDDFRLTFFSVWQLSTEGEEHGVALERSACDGHD
jgi:hypothetical protein